MPTNNQDTSNKFNLNLDLGIDVSRLPTKNFLIFSLFFFVLLIAFIFKMIVPTAQSIFTNYDAIAANQKNLETYRSKLDKLLSTSKDEDYKKKDILDAVLYDTNPFRQVHYNVDNLLAEHNLQRDRFEFSPGMVATPSAEFVTLTKASAAARNAAASDIKGYTIYLVVKGSYQNLLNFMKDIENYAPYCAITYSEIKNTLLGEVSAQLEILTQYHKPEVTASVDTNMPVLNDADKATLKRLDDFVIVDYSVDTNYTEDEYNDIFTMNSATQQPETDNAADLNQYLPDSIVIDESGTVYQIQ